MTFICPTPAPGAGTKCGFAAAQWAGFVDLFDLIVILKARLGDPPRPLSRITGGL